MVTAQHQKYATRTSWCEVSQSAIKANVAALRQRIGPSVKLGIVVKADAFGHGLVPCAGAFVEAGADWLIVNFAYEAAAIRKAGVDAPIYVCGHVLPSQAHIIAETGARIVLYDAEVARAIAAAAKAAGRTVPVHLKIETGTHRQGLTLKNALDLARYIEPLEGIVLEGVTTHYADIEDTTDHRFAHHQLTQLLEAQSAFLNAGLALPMVHSANSAATILWPETHGSLVRVGIAAYGLWPSTETYATVLQTAGSPSGFLPHLQPVLAWKTHIAQVKSVPAGGYVSYGRTFRAPYAMKIAVLPLGYHEGYDRRLSNLGYALIQGQRAPICGRVCMNMVMVDVTHLTGVSKASTVTLLGRDEDEAISAEQLATWMGTINYEVVSRIHPSQHRYLVA